MDTSALKGRMAEAFVEAIFRRAGFYVARARREAYMPRLVKVGTDEFLPDFLVWKGVPGPPGERPLHRLLSVEVKYRASLGEFLRRHGKELMASVQSEWPELLIVLVTDCPENDRSCFQVIDVRKYSGNGRPTTTDLHLVPEVDVWQKTVQEYEGLVRQIFPLLGAQSSV